MLMPSLQIEQATQVACSICILLFIVDNKILDSFGITTYIYMQNNPENKFETYIY